MQREISLVPRCVDLRCIQLLPTTSRIPMDSKNKLRGVLLESHTRSPTKEKQRYANTIVDTSLMNACVSPTLTTLGHLLQYSIAS